jgi:transcription initiation factor IIE alpha subunit
LTLFYSDLDILVCNFLLENLEISAFTDQQIADALNLTQKQVRATLESRLIKDHLVEAEFPSSNSNASSAWYRISPNIVIVSEFRLSRVISSLEQRYAELKETSMFVCPKCQRCYDLLRVISVSHFHCEVCLDEELIQEDGKSMKSDLEIKLKKFHVEIRSLRDLLDSVRNMYIPRPIIVKKSVVKEQEKILSSSSNTNNTNILSALPPVSSSSELTTASIAQEVKIISERLKEDFSKSKNTSIDYFLIKPEPVTPIKREIVMEWMETEMVSVAGGIVSFKEIRENEDRYIDRMTDEEYTKYDSLVQKWSNETTTKKVKIY